MGLTIGFISHNAHQTYVKFRGFAEENRGLIEKFNSATGRILLKDGTEIIKISTLQQRPYCGCADSDPVFLKPGNQMKLHAKFRQMLRQRPVVAVRHNRERLGTHIPAGDTESRDKPPAKNLDIQQAMDLFRVFPVLQEIGGECGRRDQIRACGKNSHILKVRGPRFYHRHAIHGRKTAGILRQHKNINMVAFLCRGLDEVPVTQCKGVAVHHRGTNLSFPPGRLDPTDKLADAAGAVQGEYH